MTTHILSMRASKYGHCGDCIKNDTCPLLLMRIMDKVNITGCKDIERKPKGDTGGNG